MPALPFAVAALPVYVHVPKFYGDTLGIDLAAVGVILLALRLLDAISDPLIGAWSDRSGHRPRLIGWAIPLLAIGVVALLNPPALPPGSAVLWLAASAAITYAGYSLAMINHQAMGAELSTDPHQRTRITGVREALSLLGVMIASIVPALFADARDGLRALSWTFAGLLLASSLLFALRAPRAAALSALPARDIVASLAAALGVSAFRRLLCVYALSGIAVAIPATLVLFYVKDVIGDEASQGWFLGAYFAAGALGMPLWIAASRRLGKVTAWVLAMLLAIASFAWAWRLGIGDTMPFLIICALSGLAAAADLALPPSMLADAIDTGPPDVGTGAYFGVWTFVTKLNLALAAGIALPLLQWLDYRPGAPTVQGAAILAAVYAGLPCVLKLLAAVLAWTILPTGDARLRSPVDRATASS